MNGDLLSNISWKLWYSTQKYGLFSFNILCFLYIQYNKTEPYIGVDIIAMAYLVNNRHQSNGGQFPISGPTDPPPSESVQKSTLLKLLKLLQLWPDTPYWLTVCTAQTESLKVKKSTPIWLQVDKFYQKKYVNYSKPNIATK